MADFVLVIWLFKKLTDSEIGRFYAQIVKLADFMFKLSNWQILRSKSQIGRFCLVIWLFHKFRDSKIGNSIYKFSNWQILFWLFKTLTDSEIGRFYAQIVKLADFMFKL